MKLLGRLCLGIAVLAPWAPAEGQATQGKDGGAELRFVVSVSRHGVRSPTGKAAQWSAYSSGTWPVWDVPPGFLTEHGFRLIERLGAYDRLRMASEGLVGPTGCTDAGRIAIHADSDQRTRETGRALAKGLFPGCEVRLTFLPEGTNDPLFHRKSASAGEARLATAAVSGRMGGDSRNLTVAYRPLLEEMDGLLARCGKTAGADAGRASLLEVPARLSVGTGDHLVDAKGPLFVASTLSENFLLEYTEGMAARDVGWGCVDGARVRSLIALHTAATDYTQRTRAVAGPQARNLLHGIASSLEQAAGDKPVEGALSKPGDRALFLVGHDTNLENIAGLLDLNWIVDGRRDDTPPGSALVFELWRDRGTGASTIKVFFTAQTLEQMRLSSALSRESAPERVPVFVPGCGREDGSCTWSAFARMIHTLVAGDSDSL